MQLQPGISATPAASRQPTGGATRPERSSSRTTSEQLVALDFALGANPTLQAVLTRGASLDLPDWYLAGGCVFQTVWNVVTGRPAAYGIRDYDIFYFDSADLSQSAEAAIRRTVAAVVGDLGVEVDVVNQARVHVWYEQEFGVPCPAHDCTESAIDCFVSTTCCVGVRRQRDGGNGVYAPHGLTDIFNLVLRPNPRLDTQAVYDAKGAIWRRRWPELTIAPWPREGGTQVTLSRPPGSTPHRPGRRSTDFDRSDEFPVNDRS